jgi:hypothetical protein
MKYFSKTILQNKHRTNILNTFQIPVAKSAHIEWPSFIVSAVMNMDRGKMRI